MKDKQFSRNLYLKNNSYKHGGLHICFSTSSSTFICEPLTWLVYSTCVNYTRRNWFAFHNICLPITISSLSILNHAKLENYMWFHSLMIFLPIHFKIPMTNRILCAIWSTRVQYSDKTLGYQIGIKRKNFRNENLHAICNSIYSDKIQINIFYFHVIFILFFILQTHFLTYPCCC